MPDKGDPAKKTQTFDNQTHLEHGQQEAPNAKPLTTSNMNNTPTPKPRPRD